MVGIAVADNSQSVTLVGYGLELSAASELAPGIALLPKAPSIELSVASECAQDFRAYAAFVASEQLKKFSVRVTHQIGGQVLAAHAWNALWVFHLMSLACCSPCYSLYAISDGPKPTLTAANRNVFFRHKKGRAAAADKDIAWAQIHYKEFGELTRHNQFSPSIRSLGNAVYLPDLDTAIMLLWSGIEGLLGVDAELSRRLALYASLLIGGSSDEKLAFYQRVKKAYGDRSKVVHGTSLKPEKLATAYSDARSILTILLRRCVELGRVPSAEEFDRVAVAGVVA